MLRTTSGRTRAPICSLIDATFAASALSRLAVNRTEAGQPNSAAEIRHQVTRSFKFADPGSNRPITVLPNTTVSVRRSCRVCQVASPRNQLYSSDQEVARIWRPLAVSTHTCDDFEDQRVARACWRRHLLISRTRCRAEPACPRNRAARSCRSDRSPDVCCRDRGSDRRWIEHRWRDRN